MVKASNSCLKKKSYFKRYQVKPKRRRQGKTDYAARRILIRQQKNKYATPKYRLIARKTNRKIIAQIAKATIKGDIIITQASSSELPRYGVKLGLTNYPAAYMTGLLLARRHLAKLELADMFEGFPEVTGQADEENDGERTPFIAYLDVGLTRTSTGNNMFGVLKGAVDGGINVPFSGMGKRFPGWDQDADDGKGELVPEAHRDRIFGKHIAENMNRLQEEEDDDNAYKKQYARYIKAGITGDQLEDIYKKAHAAIRADPSPAKKAGGKAKYNGPFKRKPRLTLEQRREQLKQRIAELQAAAMEDDD